MAGRTRLAIDEYKSARVFLVYSHGEIIGNQAPIILPYNTLAIHTGEYCAITQSTIDLPTLQRFSTNIDTTVDILFGQDQPATQVDKDYFREIYSKVYPEKFYEKQLSFNPTPGAEALFMGIREVQKGIGVLPHQEAWLPIIERKLHFAGTRSSIILQLIRQNVPSNQKIIVVFVACSVVSKASTIHRQAENEAEGTGSQRYRYSVVPPSPYLRKKTGMPVATAGAGAAGGAAGTGLRKDPIVYAPVGTLPTEIYAPNADLEIPAVHTRPPSLLTETYLQQQPTFSNVARQRAADPPLSESWSIWIWGPSYQEKMYVVPSEENIVKPAHFPTDTDLYLFLKQEHEQVDTNIRAFAGEGKNLRIHHQIINRTPLPPDAGGHIRYRVTPEERVYTLKEFYKHMWITGALYSIGCLGGFCFRKKRYTALGGKRMRRRSQKRKTRRHR